MFLLVEKSIAVQTIWIFDINGESLCFSFNKDNVKAHILQIFLEIQNLSAALCSKWPHSTCEMDLSHKLVHNYHCHFREANLRCGAD